MAQGQDPLARRVGLELVGQVLRAGPALSMARHRVVNANTGSSGPRLGRLIAPVMVRGRAARRAADGAHCRGQGADEVLVGRERTGRLCQQEADFECTAAPPAVAARAHFAIMQFNQALDERQSQAESPVLAVGRMLGLHV
jgi:hypothetical protein